MTDHTTQSWVINVHLFCISLSSISFLLFGVTIRSRVEVRATGFIDRRCLGPMNYAYSIRKTQEEEHLAIAGSCQLAC